MFIRTNSLDLGRFKVLILFSLLILPIFLILFLLILLFGATISSFTIQHSGVDS